MTAAANTVLLSDPSQGWPDETPGWPALVFVDLDACPATAFMGPLPPYPVIGIGDPQHPLAAQLDALVEAPVTVEMLEWQIGHAPHAAAVTVQLLRQAEGLPLERALAMESLSYGVLQAGAEHSAWLATREASARLPEGCVRVERSGTALRLVLDRPAARNAIDRTMRDDLHEAFTLAALDPDVRRITLAAVGAAFCMGGDLQEFGTTRDPAVAHLLRARTLPAAALIRCADRLEAHVQGACVGAGIEIAAFARRVTAAPGAWFQLPELSMGLLPGAGGSVSVPRRIGRQRAALMMLSGRRINATTALRWGLIDAIEDAPPADDRGAHAAGG